MSDTVKVVSFNIEYCASITKGYWQYITSFWKYLIPHNINAIWKIAELISRENADVATFMEIDGGSFRTMHKNYLNILSQLTNLKKNVFFPVRHIGGFSNQGNGILSKYEVLEVRNIKLETHGENRYLSISKLKIDGKTINVMTTQLALGHISRRKEIQHIARIINDTPGPMILTGDLNTNDEKELELFDIAGLQRVGTPNTFPSWKPKRRIDYIFYSSEFELINSYSVPDMKVSDHLPIVAEFKLKK